MRTMRWIQWMRWGLGMLGLAAVCLVSASASARATGMARDRAEGLMRGRRGSQALEPLLVSVVLGVQLHRQAGLGPDHLQLLLRELLDDVVAGHADAGAPEPGGRSPRDPRLPSPVELPAAKEARARVAEVRNHIARLKVEGKKDAAMPAELPPTAKERPWQLAGPDGATTRATGRL